MRLIDAEALNHAVSNIDMHGRSEQFYEIMGEIAEVLSSAPIIEAEPVRHGRWEPIGGDTNRPMCACTQCWEETAELECREYCGNCGAKMDTTRAEAEQEATP